MVKKKMKPKITERVNTTKLVELVAAELSIPEEDARDAVMTVFNVVLRALASGHNVALTNFGTFIAQHQAKRTARNPMTGEPVQIPARWMPKFRYSDAAVEAVRGRNKNAVIDKAPKWTKTPHPGTISEQENADAAD